MVQLEVISGNTAGTRWTARRFPVRIGRSSQADFQIEGAGVWDEHATLYLERNEGFVLRSGSNAIVHCNGESIEQVVLRNGDRIELGAVALRFWLAEARQRSLAVPETVFWLLLLSVVLGQIGLIYWLVRL